MMWLGRVLHETQLNVAFMNRLTDNINTLMMAIYKKSIYALTGWLWFVASSSATHPPGFAVNRSKHQGSPGSAGESFQAADRKSSERLL
jgi:hypothetical protein